MENKKTQGGKLPGLHVIAKFEGWRWRFPAFPSLDAHKIALFSLRVFVVSVTRRLQAYYGQPTVLARDRRPEGDHVETIAGYQWQQGDSSGVLLFFFSVEQGKNSYTTVSIHYRAELPEGPAARLPPPNKSEKGVLLNRCLNDNAVRDVCRNGKNSSRFKPIAFHGDLLRFWIFAGLDFVRRVAGCSEPGHHRVETAHRCTKLRGFLLVIDHDDLAGREF